MVKMGGFSVEALTAVFLLVGSFGQPDMSLTGSGSFLEWIHWMQVLLSV
jgi:hypothetical protein